MIELDEEKTVAAAATATGIYIRGIQSYKVFLADHPFMFFVINNRKNEIIFLGRFMKPTGRKPIEMEYLAHNLEARKKERLSIADWGSQRILYVINKKIYQNVNYDTIDWGDVESINIIKDKKEIRKYSSENYDAAILITLKKKRKKKI